MAKPVASPRPIDYILVGQGVEVTRHACIPDNNGRDYPSDHLPLVAQVTFRQAT